MNQYNSIRDEVAPGRGEVEELWVSLIEGRQSREEVHARTVYWVEEDGDLRINDPMVRNALQHLHGFDLRRHPQDEALVHHGGEGSYVSGDDAVAAALAAWRERCREYDEA